MKYGKAAGEGFAEISQFQLNNLVDEVEFYKFQHGNYLDSLQQLMQRGKVVMIYDPPLARKMIDLEDQIFRYKKFEDKYTLFLVGIDGIPNTADDIYPQIPDSLSNKYGFVKPAGKFR